MSGTFQDFQNIVIEPYVLVDQVSSTLIYIGTSTNGNNVNNPTWRIKKISQNGTVWSVGFPNGDQTFTFIWRDRNGFTYN
jgi:hypothetical protein